ncbi:hypothetical protein ACGYLM_07345 [Sulfitobacter sp. 1A10445]|uniref:hypothetical protein n=1 Tax=unclassified Sulfitobacter TaxID=196795 RepID=UPI003746CFD6
MSDESYEMLARKAAGVRRARLLAEQRREAALAGKSDAELSAVLEAEAMAGTVANEQPNITSQGNISDFALQFIPDVGEQRRAQEGETSFIEQSMSGVNEGIAGILGAPVDLMTGAINMGKHGVNALAGTDYAPIENPVGGSNTFRDLLAPTISEVEPQNAAERFGRRVGMEVGAMAVPGGIMLRGAKAPLTVAGGEAASAVGSGIAGQTSREIAPENNTADFIASLAGGLSPVAASRAMRPSPKAPTLEELQAQSEAGYNAVRESGATLSPQSADALAGGIEGTFGTRPATRRMNPKAAIAAEELAGDMRQRPPTIAEVDEARQWIGDNVAGSNEAGERRLGAMMKDAIDSHLDQLQPGDVTGTNRANEVVGTLTDAREKARRVHKSQLFEAEDTGLVAKGLRRAATTGTGGNEVNAIRQNVRRVLENPKLRRGFSDTELQAMRDIADGTPTQNALRLIGRLAPTSGALPLGGFTGAAGATGVTGNPLFIAPAVAGQGAKYLGERSARKQIEALGELIRNGEPLPKKTSSDLEKRIVAALMAQKVGAPNSQVEGGRGAVVRALMGAQVQP